MLLISLAFANKGHSQVVVSAKLSATEYEIGENITLILEAKRDLHYLVFFPDLVDSINNMEILSFNDIKEQVNEDHVILTGTVNLIAFDSGYFTIPPICFKYRKEETSKMDSVFTKPLSFNVSKVKVDVEEQIKAIKDPLDIPFSIKDIWQYLLIGYFLLLLISLYVYWREKVKNAKKGIVKPVMTKVAHEIALARLRDLEEEKYWQKGEVKRYYTGISEIVREYIENRFTILALESTSGEIIDDFKSIVIADDIKEDLKELLLLSDLVKFAKLTPLPEDHERCLAISYSFIRDTKPSISKEKESADVA